MIWPVALNEKMVEDIKIRLNFFQCEESKHIYKDIRLAEKCEAYCKKYHKCSIPITEQVIPLKKPSSAH